MRQPSDGDRRPAVGRWWPSRWGEGDEKGALNLLGPDQARQAAALIKTGEVLEMGFPFRAGYPDFHHRDFILASAGGPSGGPVGAGKYMYNDEVISGRFTGMSTHFNALVHVGQQLGEVGDNRTLHYYNGFTHTDIGTAWGFRKLGIEQVDPIFAPGILIDVAAYRGEALKPGDIIAQEDLLGALAHQGMSEADICPGSAVFWRTGNDHLWFSEPDRYIAGSAGLRPETATWLAERDVVVVGADAVSLEPVPPVDDRLAEVHATFLCRYGIYVIVNVNLQALSERRAWRFAFCCTPIPFEGAQGSPARPFAII